MKHSTITLSVNGQEYALTVAPNQTLLDVLRDDLSLTGTKKGCDEGTCGACTVIIDGRLALSCMVLAIRCGGKTIETIEGLAQNGTLHPLQQAAIDNHAVQCGFCTPGWLLSAKVLLENQLHPSRDEVKSAIAGNLCRCTGYTKIEDAILAAADAEKR
jgi:carbon-monoxide dehydrogenase small subunit